MNFLGQLSRGIHLQLGSTGKYLNHSPKHLIQSIASRGIVTFLGQSLPTSHQNGGCQGSPLSGHVQGRMPLTSPYFSPCRTYRIKANPKRRCKDCQLVFIDGLLHNLCKTAPRHKQRQKPSYESTSRIISSVCVTPRKPW